MAAGGFAGVNVFPLILNVFGADPGPDATVLSPLTNNAHTPLDYQLTQLLMMDPHQNYLKHLGFFNRSALGVVKSSSSSVPVVCKLRSTRLLRLLARCLWLAIG
jgi:hypothetical protein